MKKRLLQVKLIPSAFKDLECIKNVTGLGSMADVVRLAIAYFKWFIDRKKRGYKFYMISPNNEKEEIEFPSLF